MGRIQSARSSVDWPWKVQKKGSGSPAGTEKRPICQPSTGSGAPVALVKDALTMTVEGKRL